MTQEAERGLTWITSTGLRTHCVLFMQDRSSSIERTWPSIPLLSPGDPGWTPGLCQPRLRCRGWKWGHGDACQPQRGSVPGWLEQHGSPPREQHQHVSFRCAEGPSCLLVLPAASLIAPAPSFCVVVFPVAVCLLEPSARGIWVVTVGCCQDTWVVTCVCITVVL